MEGSISPRVLIADDHALIREGIGLLIQGEWEGARCQYAPDLHGARIALSAPAGGASFDAVILDLKMPGMHGLESVQEVCALAGTARVIVCTAMDDPGLARRLATTGVFRVVSKNHASDQLLGALRAAVLCTEPAHGVAGRPASSVARNAGSASLTNRQRDILHLLHEGMPNKVIASHLGVEVGTVKSHLHLLYVAMGVTNRSEAIAKSHDWFI